MPRAFRLVVIALLACAALVTAPAAALASGPDTSAAAASIAYLNQQRQANGIPAFTRVDNSLASSWCPAESSGPMTEARVLAGGTDPLSFSAGASPWSQAPLHQLLMYDPLARSAGWATMTNAPFDGGEVMPYLECMGFSDEAADPAAPTAYTFFSELGPNAVRPTLDVQGEGPFAPQELVGISQGTPTGPQPIFYLLGMGRVRAVSWSLTDTSTGAAVPGVSVVTSYQVEAAGYDPSFLWNNGVMITPPLQPGTVYSGHAEFTGAGGTCLDETFSFATLNSDGSPLGTRVAPLNAQPCARAAGPALGPLAIGRVAARWSAGHLVVRATLSSGQHLTVKQGRRQARTSSGVVRRTWPFAAHVVVWVTQSGRSSRHLVLTVSRG